MTAPSGELHLAAPGLFRRLASMAYECLLLVGVLATLVLLPQTIYAISAQKTAPAWIVACHSTLILCAYFVWFWRHGGQTLAMKTWKIRLENAHDDGKITLPQAWLRFALCWPSLLLFGAGLIWALIDRDHQFLHDRLAGTRLVSVAPPTRSSTLPPTGTSRSA